MSTPPVPVAFLMALDGVDPKVASCVALFGLHQLPAKGTRSLRYWSQLASWLVARLRSRDRGRRWVFAGRDGGSGPGWQLTVHSREQET